MTDWPNPAPWWGERQPLVTHHCCIHTYIHTWLCQGKSADKDSTQENHYKLVFNNTAVRTKDMLRFTDSRGVLYVVRTATQKPFFMLSRHFIMEWAMSCELPLLVPFIGIVLSPGCAIKWWAYKKNLKKRRQYRQLQQKYFLKQHYLHNITLPSHACVLLSPAQWRRFDEHHIRTSPSAQSDMKLSNYYIL